MRKPLITLTILAAALTMAACSQQTAEQKVQAAVAKVHALNPDERALAATNAKQFFEKEWPVSTSESARGFFIECRPSDSNFNGLVTCFGKVPQVGGGFKDIKRYCGYQPALVGCSDEDTAK